MASVSVFNTTRFTALASGDVIGAVDISDTSQSAHGSFDSITVTNFFATIPAPVNVTSASATALAVGLTGATNPAFTVDASTALQVAGLKVTGAVTGGTVAMVVTDSGSNTNLTVNAKGSGTIGIGSVSTGRVTITPATTITGALTQTGLATFNGGATIASGQTLTVTGATVTGLTAASVATGTFPGVYTITGAVTLSAALTYGGVTLTNAVTGTGKMVLSAAPALTGTTTIAATGGLGVGGTPTYAVEIATGGFRSGRGFQANSNTGSDIWFSAEGTVTGQAVPFKANISATTAVVVNVNNTNNTAGAGADAVLGMSTQTGGGNPAVLWNISGATNWCMGLNNAASDVFTLTAGTTLGTGDVLTADTAGKVGFLGVIASTVSTLTNPLTIGANGGATTYGAISFNNALGSGSAAIVGLTGGGGTDKTLYYLVPTGGTHSFRVNDIQVGAFLTTGVIVASSTPSSAAATGTAGTITWDTGFVYVCTAANTWKRAAIATW